MAGSLNDAANQVGASASQFSSGSQALAEGASEQAASLEETSASLEELSLENIRTAKKDEIVLLISTAAEFSYSDPQTIQDVLDLVRSTDWNVVKHTNKSVSLQAPHSKTPLHIRWEELIASIRHDLALNVAEREGDERSKIMHSLDSAKTSRDYPPKILVRSLEM